MYKKDYLTINLLTKKGYIEENKKTIYNYGFFILLNFILVFIITILSGMFNKIILESIIFMISASSMRLKIGGFHFQSVKSCYIISIISFVLIPFLIKNIKLNIDFILVSIIIINIYILRVAPLDNKNKPLNKAKKRKIRIKLIKQMFFWIIVTSLLYQLDMIIFMRSMFFSYSWCFIILIATKIFA